MQKIISLFQRNYTGDRQVRDEVVPGAEWVVAGEGIATVKEDGTCCLVRAGLFYKRYEVHRGKRPPANFEPASDIDPVTGKQQGWVPVGDGPEDQWHRAAWLTANNWGSPYDPAEYSILPDGTYELVGPKVQGNPYRLAQHEIRYHGWDRAVGAPRTFAALRDYLAEHPIEGIVWHHPDGRMVKVKRKDFGLPWPVPPTP